MMPPLHPNAISSDKGETNDHIHAKKNPENTQKNVIRWMPPLIIYNLDACEKTVWYTVSQGISSFLWYMI